MKRAALALSLLLLLPLPAGAQDSPLEGAPSEREVVVTAFRAMVDRGAMREYFGLPLETFWRREGTLDLALFAEDETALLPVLEGAAAPFAEAAGLQVSVIGTGPVPSTGQDTGDLMPEADLVIIVGSRLDLYELAAENGFDNGMLAHFELGTWPFMFRFDRDAGRRGVVLLADDEPERAREAAFILATVWALGGVTMGPELTGLVEDSEAGPQLTPRGEAVFGLFYDEGLEVGMPLSKAVQRAGALLPQ
jgi:hypothetical protein